MPLWKNKAYNLTESQIRYAMRNTGSNLAASRFLKISYGTYKKYAKMYIDEETGEDLFELHKNQSGKGMRKRFRSRYGGKKKLKEILEGKHPTFPWRKLKNRLIRDGFKAEECELCGFNERRVTDYTVPLILIWKNGDKRDHRAENLELVCYNCYYLTHSDLYERQADALNFTGYRDDN